MLRSVLMVLALLPAGLFPCAIEAAALCARWLPPQAIGQLSVRDLPEASGLAVAAAGERLYLHNDGDRPGFVVTDRAGSTLHLADVEGFSPRDLEDMSLGRCGEHTCLVLADVGDNSQTRKSVQIALIELAPQIDGAHRLRAVVSARYPDGPHNAEAVALHPSGDLFLVTKSGSGLTPSGAARVYRLAAGQLAAAGEQQFEFRGEIPVSTLVRSLIASRRVVTSMDIAPDGGRFVLLTYDAAVEFAADLTQALPAPGDWVEERTFRAFPIAPLIQAEAAAYDVDGRSILYTTESINGSAAPLMRQACSE